MRIAIAQINPIVGDFAYNLDKILDNVKAAKSQEADLLVFPEMVITGYPPEDLLFKKHFIQKSKEMLKKMVPTVRGLTVVVGYVDADRHDVGKRRLNRLA